MNFHDFLQYELQDNGSLRLSKKDENTYCLFNILKDKEIINKEIKVKTYYNRRDDVEVNGLLKNVSEELREKLTNKTFIKNNCFLFSEEEYEHNTVDNFLNYNSGSNDTLDKSTIQTGNLVGYVNKNNYSIVVSSRFGDNFLKHLIASTDGFLELPEQGDAKKAGMAEWLLIFLWKMKLKHAYRLGLPKEYVSQIKRTVSFRGNMTMHEAIINPSFIPPYECIYREHSYDNYITQLISNTFRLVRDKSLLEDCHKLRQDFNTATEGKRFSVNELLDYNPIKNPYFSDYNFVADLSKRIIKKEMADFSSEKDDFSAFFFDISMLFEHFIRKILIRKGFTLEQKNSNKYAIPNGGDYNSGQRRLYPDIIILHNDGSVDVFDVKYKRYDFNYGVGREDLFQMNTYVANVLNNQKVNKCGFIFPIEEQDPINNPKKHISQKLCIAGHDILFEVHFFVVPNDSNDNFSLRFNESITNFQS